MIHFVTNDKGEKIAVQIPIKEWEAINNKLKYWEQMEAIYKHWKQNKKT